jgi:hypothetical protein
MTPDDLRQLYIDEKLTDREIGQRIGQPYGYVMSLRKKYGIATIAKSERHELPPLTEVQHALLLGSLLGDARLFSTGSKTAALSEFHSEKQTDYLQWKVALWSGYICSVRHSKQVKNGRLYTGNILRTHGCTVLRPFWGCVYPEGSGDKVFTGLDLSRFSPLSLAVWYLDDGGKTSNGYVRFAVTPHKDSQSVLLNLLRGLGLDPVLHQDKDPALWIHDRASLTKFLDYIAPEVPASMHYKLELLPRARGPAPRQVLTRDMLVENIGKGRTIEWVAEASGVSTASVKRALGKEGLRAPNSSVTPTWPEAKSMIRLGIDEDALINLLTELPMPSLPSHEVALRDFYNLKTRTLVTIDGEGVINGGGRLGLTACERWFPYLYDASGNNHPSLRQAWFDERYVREAVAYQRQVGDPVYPANVFRALKALITTPFNFRPSVAKKIAEDFSPMGGLVLDPCAGYGGRALRRCRPAP